MLAGLPERVCGWYAENKRDLPWRGQGDPYRIWVSEIMLQQTRVEAVRPYYMRFLGELPDVKALASCPEEKLLKLWEGLGYYSRVRNMQRAACMIVEEFDGQFPETAEELRKLPGIGSYTAGAIASIAFGERVPAVDGNVLRIIARLTADGENVLSQSVKRSVEAVLTEVLKDCADPGAFNQGMMDLGAGICLPNAQPLCERCPLAERCMAHRAGNELAYPVRTKAKERRVEHRTVLLIRDGERVALTKRPDRGLLAGMFEFPCLQGECTREEALAELRRRRLEPLRIAELGQARHLFSHVEWRMTGYEIRIASFSGAGTGDWILTDIEQIEREHPIPSAYRAYAERIRLRLGSDAIGKDIG